MQVAGVPGDVANALPSVDEVAFATCYAPSSGAKVLLAEDDIVPIGAGTTSGTCEAKVLADVPGHGLGLRGARWISSQTTTGDSGGRTDSCIPCWDLAVGPVGDLGSPA